MKVLKALKSIGLPATAVGKMRRIAAGGLFACLLSVALPACGGSEEPEPEPKPVVPDEPEKPVVYDNYIEFKFKGKDYQIANDENCIFSRRSDSYYLVSGSTASVRQAFTMNMEVKIAQGGSYDIYASSLYVSSTIHLLFTAGEGLVEESFSTDDMSKVDVIGKLSITELSDSRLSGTFSCRTTTGEITDGKFSVKAKEYE
ncbi:MAG: hypothetical protein LBL07_07050 [Tannerella sp.]|jgi:hypothetical protein|nr:hypothetical protein [Tannerella sp.]